MVVIIEMIVQDNFQRFKTLLDRNDFLAVHEIMKEKNEVDIADYLEELAIDQALLVFRMLNKDKALEVFSHLNDEMQQNIINAITDKEVALLINDLWMDDAVDMLEEMPATLVKKVLRNSSAETRDLINQYLHYPENSAGRIMTSQYVDLKKNMTVQEAIARVKQVSNTVETIYTCFVTDETRVLESALPLKDLLFADKSKLIGDLPVTNPVYTMTTADQEVAAQLIFKYHLMSLPVVDDERRLVGIITADDAVEVIIEEETEDFERMAAIRPSETPYTKTSAFALAMNRFPWLVVALVLNILISFVVDVYSPVYVAVPILVSFMPMLMGTGGNAGSQTSTLIIRGMALGEISMVDFWKVLWKEIRVCLVLGVALGAINFTRIAILNPDQIALAAVVTISLICGMFVGKTTGAALPLLAKAINIDPAIMSAPIITTIVDIMAIVVFFSLSQVAISMGGLGI